MTDDEYQQYLDAWNRADDLRIAQLGERDQAVLSLSSGALAFSVALLTAFASMGAAIVWFWLLATWALLLTSIVLTVISYHSATRSAENELARLDKMVREWYDKDRDGNIGSKKKIIRATQRYDSVWWTLMLNRSSSICFILGIVSLLFFSAFSSQTLADEISDEEVALEEIECPNEYDGTTSFGAIEPRFESAPWANCPLEPQPIGAPHIKSPETRPVPPEPRPDPSRPPPTMPTLPLSQQR